MNKDERAEYEESMLSLYSETMYIEDDKMINYWGRGL